MSTTLPPTVTAGPLHLLASCQECSFPAICLLAHCFVSFGAHSNVTLSGEPLPSIRNTHFLKSATETDPFIPILLISPSWILGNLVNLLQVLTMMHAFLFKQARINAITLFPFGFVFLFLVVVLFPNAFPSAVTSKIKSLGFCYKREFLERFNKWAHWLIGSWGHRWQGK